MTNFFLTPVQGYSLVQGRLDAEIEETLTHGAWSFRLTPWADLRAPLPIAGEFRGVGVTGEVKEGWGEYADTGWDLRIGNQILSWGAADQINPTDVWNPRDFVDPFQSTKLPITVARVRVHPAEWEHVALEFDVAPFFREARIPIKFPTGSTLTSVRETDSRWLIQLPSGIDLGGSVSPLYYRLAEANYPVSWQLGGKILLQRFGGWDFSISGYSGVESTPRVGLTKTGTAGDPLLPLTITLHPSFHRQWMVGLDGSGSVAIGDRDVGLRFEAAYFKRDNSRAQAADPTIVADLMKDDYIHAVVGADYTFLKKFLGTVVYTNLQFVIYQKIGSVETEAGRYVLEGVPNVSPWDRNLAFYLENRLDSKWKLATQFITSFVNNDALITPAVQTHWSDHLSTSLGIDLFFGPQRGFFGQFKDNDRVVFKLNLTI
jgi:hypothetical protein